MVAVPAQLFGTLTASPQLEADAELRASVRALWHGSPWDADCEEVNRDSGATPGLIRHALADGTWLIEVACAQGAYQGSFWAVQMWASQNGPAHAAVLRWQVAAVGTSAAPPGFDTSVQVVVWGELAAVASSPDARREAEIVTRFRGIGDCGTRSRYAIERGTTRLAALAANFICPETLPDAPSGPADWASIPLPGR